jgi:phosphoadenylyl-sulfate reductase (thioredoxin)
MLAQSLREADALPLEDIESADAIEAPASADWRAIAPHAGRLSRIDIRFDSFKEGRGFTLATQLREKAGFTGELRAIGDLLPDQARFLKRVGFDVIRAERNDPLADWDRALARFPRPYQPATDSADTVIARRAAAGDELAALNRIHAGSDADEILRAALQRWTGEIAVLSSFGAEAAVGLHRLARIDPSVPIFFLDTGRHFAQTEQYQRELTETLGLTDVRILKPDAEEAASEDPNDTLWKTDPDACCALRKVRPLDKALDGFSALITGRKQIHGGDRLVLPAFERVHGRVRVNPLTRMTAKEIEAWFETHGLPRHPLTAQGYASIGCWTCTAPAREGGGLRDGRWPGQDKTECGIHAPDLLARAG